MPRATAKTVLIALCVGCASSGGAPSVVSSPSRSTPLADMLARDLAAEHAFPWSGARRLTWSDFRGSPPRQGPEGALTAYGLFYARKCVGRAFEFRVIAAFRPERSWVKAAVLNDSAQRRSVLAHEQTHFDLSEVYARRMRRVFGELEDPCGKGDAALDALAERLVQEEKAEQRRYDDETNHGLLALRQAAWTSQVARRLAALGRYAA